MATAYDIVMSNRQEIVDKLIAQMEKGYASTRAAWSQSSTGRPYNPVSNAVYRGGNRFRLMIAAEENGFGDPRWMTYKQAADKNYQIVAGSKGVLLEKWIFHKDVPKLDENGKQVNGADGKPELEHIKLDKPIVNYFRVFNGEQIVGLPELEKKELTEDYYSKTAEVFEQSSKCPVLYEQQDSAYYSPVEDKIHLPPKESFKNNEARLSVLLHEMAHSTGHESRMDRPIKNSFGSVAYAIEELNAELSSVFLENELGINMEADSEMLKDHANYVNSWMSVLKENPNELFVACANADKITEFLMENYEKHLEIEMDKAPTKYLVEAMELLGYEQIDTGNNNISFGRIEDHLNHGDTQGWTFQYNSWSEVRRSLDNPRLFETKEVTEAVNNLARSWDGEQQKFPDINENAMKENVFEEKEIAPEQQELLDDNLKNRNVEQPYNLSNKDFMGIRFTGVLKGIDFSKSRFINCVFENAHLSGNKMNGTSFHDCKFSYGYMEGVDLSGSSFYGTQFEHHEMNNNSLERAYISNTFFSRDCVISDNDFLNARISNTQFGNEEKYWQLNLDTVAIHNGGSTAEEYSNYRKDVIEHLTEADEHAVPRIRQMLKEQGFIPTKTLVENIKSLEKSEMRKLSLKDIVQFSKIENCFEGNSAKQHCLGCIVGECKSQELEQVRETPQREQKFLKQEMIADIELTRG